MSEVFYLEIEKTDGNITVFNLDVIDDFKIDFDERLMTLIAYKGSHRESKIRINDLKSARMYESTSRDKGGYKSGQNGEIDEFGKDIYVRSLNYEVIDCEDK